MTKHQENNKIMTQPNKEQSRLPTGDSQNEANNGNTVEIRTISDGNGNESDTTQTRPRSDVFLPTDVAVDTGYDKAGVSGAERAHLDSGYRTGTSTSSCMTDPEWTPAHTFYISQGSVDSSQAEQSQLDEFHELDDILLDNNLSLDDGSRVDDDDDDGVLSDYDDNQCSGASVLTLREAHAPISSAVDIPSVSCFHQAHDPAMVMMGATPPRAYIHCNTPLTGITQSGTEHPNITGNHFSTGSLSNYYALSQILAEKKNTRCGRLLETGLRVTSGQLHASSSRAALYRTRTSSETEDGETPQDCYTFRHRDRSQSAPDIGVRRKLIERQCAEELRKISDQFFEEFPRKKLGKTSRHLETPKPRSYPGTSNSRQWWWQTIIQNISPARARPSQPSDASEEHTASTRNKDGDDGK